MDYLALFIIVALLELLSAALIFVFKDILHVVIALASLFLFNSILFFILQEPLFAVLQLFIMVGGVSTYMIVGSGSASYSKFKHTNYYVLASAYIVIFAMLAYGALQTSIAVSEQNVISNSFIAQSIMSNIGLFYLIALMMFGIGISSIVLMRKISGRK
ncbi:MAG: hypothetical protein ABR981_02550 [Candidatus Micrarchaeaceae archaeon]|jgi:NADH:ubiquinone oxidoreductase subunit 6 (subunit J)